MNHKGNAIASINFFIAALLILAAAGWAFIQKGCHWHYQNEANAFFEKIEKKEIKYRNINNKYLPFNFKDSAEALKELRIDPGEAEYYDFSVEQTDEETLRIIAQLKPEILKKWYLHNPESKFKLVYEKKEGKKGRLIDK